MIKLSPRLLAIATMVNQGARTLDIGCDHALLDIYLIVNLKTFSIVSDINDKALDQARKNINKYNVNCDIRLGNGLEVINNKDNIDTIIISGLGGNTIIKILANYEKITTIDKFIIQANTDIYLVRKKLSKLGLIIIDEELVEDSGIIYTVIKFQKGKAKYNFQQLFFGPILINKKGQVFEKYVKKELVRYKNIYHQLRFKNLVRRFWIKKIIHSIENL